MPGRQVRAWKPAQSASPQTQLLASRVMSIAQRCWTRKEPQWRRVFWHPMTAEATDVQAHPRCPRRLLRDSASAGRRPLPLFPVHLPVAHSSSGTSASLARSTPRHAHSARANAGAYRTRENAALDVRRARAAARATPPTDERSFARPARRKRRRASVFA